MASNMSYSRVPDGSAVWTVQAPTWNSTNNPVSLPDLLNSSITIYPTLVTESFTVVNAFGVVLTITDLTGKTLYRSSCLSDMETIAVGELQRGLYLVRVGNSTFKIMKR
jgi:hypothetical protein